jgi:phosphoribosylformylglycinamidine cyclo-ligase
VIGGLGGFGAAVAVPPGANRSVSSTDGVGTKRIAAAVGRYGDRQGSRRDVRRRRRLSGATPLFFLDYVAVGRSIRSTRRSSSAGSPRGAGSPDAPSSGARRPSTAYQASTRSTWQAAAWDRQTLRLLDGTVARPGDAIVGSPRRDSANGFSLVRALIAEYDLDLHRVPEQLTRTLGDAGRGR